MKGRALVLWLALASSGVSAQDGPAPFDIEIDNFTASRGISEVVMKVTNNTGRAVQSVFIDCVFFTADEKAIDIGKALIPAIPAGGVAYDKAAIPRTDGVQLVSCSVVRYR